MITGIQVAIITPHVYADNFFGYEDIPEKGNQESGTIGDLDEAPNNNERDVEEEDFDVVDEEAMIERARLSELDQDDLQQLLREEAQMQEALQELEEAQQNQDMLEALEELEAARQRGEVETPGNDVRSVTETPESRSQHQLMRSYNPNAGRAPRWRVYKIEFCNSVVREQY